MKQSQLSFGQRPPSSLTLADSGAEEGSSTSKKRKGPTKSSSMAQKIARTFSSLDFWTQRSSSSSKDRPSDGRTVCHQHKQPTDADTLQCTVIDDEGNRCHKRFCNDCLESQYAQSMSYILLRGKSDEYRTGKKHVFTYDYIWTCPSCAGKCVCDTCVDAHVKTDSRPSAAQVDLTSEESVDTDTTAIDNSLRLSSKLRLLADKPTPQQLGIGPDNLGNTQMMDADEAEVDNEVMLKVEHLTDDTARPVYANRQILSEVNGQQKDVSDSLADHLPDKVFSAGRVKSEATTPSTPKAVNASESRPRLVQTTIALAPKNLPEPLLTPMTTRLPLENILRRIWLYETLVRFDVFKVPKMKVLQKLDRFDDWTEDMLFAILESMSCFLAGIKTVHQTTQRKSMQDLIKALKDAGKDSRSVRAWTAAKMYCARRGASIVNLVAVEIRPEQEATCATPEPPEEARDTLLNRRAATTRRAANTAARTKVRGMASGEEEGVGAGIEFQSRAMRAQSRMLLRGIDIDLANESRDEEQKKAIAAPSNEVPNRGRGRPRKVIVLDTKEVQKVVKRGRGRPRKEATQVKTIKRGRGRPRKEATQVKTIKRGRGRPRKIPVEVSDVDSDQSEQETDEEDVQPIFRKNHARVSNKLVAMSDEEEHEDEDDDDIRSSSSSDISSSSVPSEEGELSSSESDESDELASEPAAIVEGVQAKQDVSDISTELTDNEFSSHGQEDVSTSFVVEAETDGSYELPHFEMRVSILAAIVELALQTSEVAKEVESGFVEMKRIEKESKLEEREMQQEHRERRDEVNAKRTDMHRIGKGDEWEREMSTLYRDQVYARIDHRMQCHLLCDANKARSGPLGRDTDGAEYWHLSEYNEARPSDPAGHWAWSLLVLKPSGPTSSDKIFYRVSTAEEIGELAAYVSDRCKVHEEEERQSEAAKMLLLRQQIEALVVESVQKGDSSAKGMDDIVKAIDSLKRARLEEANTHQLQQHSRMIENTTLINRLTTVKEYYMWHGADRH